MGIDHRGFNILVSQQPLHGTDVVTGFQQMGGKAVAEGVLVNTRQLCRRLGGSLQPAGAQVVTRLALSPLLREPSRMCGTLLSALAPALSAGRGRWA
jgi:hypothetical protein